MYLQKKNDKKRYIPYYYLYRVLTEKIAKKRYIPYYYFYRVFTEKNRQKKVYLTTSIVYLQKKSPKKGIPYYLYRVARVQYAIIL